MNADFSPRNFTSVGLFLMAASMLPATAGTASNQPTQHEQYMLQLINRARANGGAEMVRLGNANNVNEGPPSVNGNPWTIINTVPPLAWNTQLTAAAQSHANNLQNVDWLFNQGTYSGPHSVNSNFPGGASTSQSRISASGYTNTNSGVRTSGGWFPGPENVSVGWAGPSNGWSDAEKLAAINGAHDGLFEDFSVPWPMPPRYRLSPWR